MGDADTQTEDAPPVDKAEAIAAIDAAAATALELQRQIAKLDLPPMADLKPRERLEVFAAVDAARKAASTVKNRGEELAQRLHDPVLAALDDLGLQRAPLQGGPTIYRKRELWVGVVDDDGELTTDEAYERACAALEEAGDELAEYSQDRFNVQSLSAWVRERERELEAEARERDGLPADAPVAIDPEELLPEALRGVLRVTEKIQPAAVKS